MNIQKIAIVGCGFVGATIAYTLTISGMFSEMVLIDKDEARAKGEAMDLSHCVPFLSPMKIYAGDYSDIDDASIVVIAAGANQKPGETRIDLVEKNAAIMGSIIPNITKYNQDCILLIVSNPVDIMTYEALRMSGFPAARVIGSGTVLDSGRLKFLVGNHLGVDSRNVHTFIIGEHGDSELAVWSSANVSGIDLQDYCPICDSCNSMDEIYKIYDYVKNSAYEIIRGKGATYYAIAQATQRIIASIVKDENSILSVSTLVTGHYGLEDICLGVPAVVGSGGVKHVLDIPLSNEEYSRLRLSADTLRSTIASLNLV